MTEKKYILTQSQFDSIEDPDTEWVEIKDILDSLNLIEPLTDDEIHSLLKKHLRVSDVDGYSIHCAWEFARAIESYHFGELK